MVMRIEEQVVFAGAVTFDSTASFTPPANGWLTNGMIATTAAIDRDAMEQNALAQFVIPLHAWRIWDAYDQDLNGGAASDDLGLVNGTFGTAHSRIEAGDLKAAGATTRYARTMVALPPEYDDGGSIQLRFHAAMVTTVADNSCTLDVEAYKCDEDGTLSADLCTTAATSINSVTWADYDFVITESSRVSGEILDVRIAIACNDGATGTEVLPAIGATKLLVDIKG